MPLNLLAAADVLRTVGSVLLAILILLAMITVHECGHYLAGRLLRFRIQEFSVGFGPALFKRTKKNGEVFALRLIPLGGYCAFAGEGAVAAEGDEAATAPLRAKRKKRAKRRSPAPSTAKSRGGASSCCWRARR